MSTTNKYLSIDLDYWLSMSPNDPAEKVILDAMESDLVRIIRSSIQQRRNVDDPFQVLLAKDHDELLPSINESKCEEIVHIDFHQDIAWPIKGEKFHIHCGNFFYGVGGREEKSFTWWYPTEDARSLGICSSLEGRGIDVPEHLDPFRKENFIFKDQFDRKGLPRASDLFGVTHVGIAFSPDYCSLPAIEAFTGKSLKSLGSQARYDAVLFKTLEIVQKSFNRCNGSINILKRKRGFYG